ncbi:MAG TPA: HEAT repeat domain-containing protein [Gemmatimonadaceae bacterium]|nr:HEAT repeat domain-containing protein [Gemmatimonadaceae bacterium]
MTATSAPAAGSTEEAPFPPAPVEELLRLVVKAGRAHQLYLPNNPIYKGALDSLRGGFAAIWAKTDELPLTFSETEILWYDHVVLSEPSKSSDSLPWLFFKDGIRELKLLKGFEDKEVMALLGVLQRARKATPDEDDLLTMLWEADFAFARYRYQDLAIDPTAPITDGAETKKIDPQAVEQATHSAVSETQAAAGIVNISDFDATLYFLDDNEIEYLHSEIDREYAEDLRSRVTSTLLDIFEQQTKTTLRAEILEILDSTLVTLLATGHFRGVAHLLREVHATIQRAPELSAEHKQALTELPVRLSAPESLAQLLQSLDDAAELPPQAELMELFDQLRPIALGTVFNWLRRMHNPKVRPLLEAAAERLASLNTSELVRLILAEEREVALEAIRRAGALKTPATVQSLSKILSGPDVELRQMAVHALTEIGSPSALQALERGVEDADREVRISTVRAFTARGYKLVLPRIETAVKSKAIRDADLTEKMAFFEAFGALSGDAGIEYLDMVLNGKGFLGRREDSELRACAAIALGRISSQKAADVLRKASSEKDVVVRNAVNRALRGAIA